MPKPPARLAWIDARRIDEFECVASVLLAILLAHAIGAENVSWAAFSGYMVMRGHAAETVLRGILRIIGTIAGGVLALLLVPPAAHSLVIATLVVGLVAAVTLYAAITARRAYAWLFVGLTFVMVLFDKLEHPAARVLPFVETRILEVIAGTFACMLVSLVSTVTLRRYWPAIRSAPAKSHGWHPESARHAAQAAVAVMLLPWLGAAWQVPALAQSAVTIMAVMLVPVTGIGPSGLAPVSRRLLYRFIGCIAGAALAAVFLLTAQGSAPILILGTMIGVAIGRHIENGSHTRTYVGTQFTLAILTTLVPDSYVAAEIGPGLERLAGILIGVVLLEPVLIAWHLLSPARRGVEATTRGELGDI